ncbi:MAG: arylsulfatase [Verrucomicrobiales bacterium]|nr:arylsulfatase [Verrucomicrobiales bacterium]
MLLRFLALTTLALTPLLASEGKKPNLLLIMADDLGYSDLGCYGSEIQTPHLDAVAENGLRFTQFYNTARCWPTRSSLLTGFYAQQIRRDKLPDIPSGGNRARRQDWAVLAPRLLAPVGYRSYHSGKWHIDGQPIENGFDRSYLLKDQSRFFNPQIHYLDDEKLPPVELGTDYYGTTAVADHSIKVLKEHADQHGDKPFFHYIGFAAPHFPLHALPEDIAIYEDTYDAGWEVIRQQRWARMKELGVVDTNAVAEPSVPERKLGPPYHFADAYEILGPGEVRTPLPWEDLNREQKEFQATKMAIHAAMIHRMDIEIGRIFDQIKSMGEWDNTLVMFLSDNGASAEIMVRADGHDPEAPLGSAPTYLCLGPGWSTTCNTPFRRHKTWTHEGGTATPFIVSWPKGIAARGETRNNPGHVIDVVPTMLELAGAAPHPDAPPSPGKSLVPVFEKDGSVEHDQFWWYHDDHRAIRIGDWKAVAPQGEPWELYDLSNDRGEMNNLAKSQPEKLQQLVKAWEATTEEFTELVKKDLSPEELQKAKSKPGRPDAMKKAQEDAKRLSR